jgi:hypothetical protein
MDGMRALKAITIAMAVLIVVGTTALIAIIIHRSSAPSASAQAWTLALDEPAGTHIAGVAGAGDRLAVQLQGGGPDRVVVVDPRSGAVSGRIGVGRQGLVPYGR